MAIEDKVDVLNGLEGIVDSTSWKVIKPAAEQAEKLTTAREEDGKRQG